MEAGHPGYFDDQEYEVCHHLFIIVLLSHNHHFIVLLVLFSMFGLSFNSKNKSEKNVWNKFVFCRSTIEQMLPSLNLVPVTESISGSVVPLAMFVIP